MKNLSETFSPLQTMRKLAVCAVLVFVCANAHAQSTNFEELAKIKGVEYVQVNKDMIKLAGHRVKERISMISSTISKSSRANRKAASRNSRKQP